MGKKKLKYGLGTVFCVPLRKSNYGIGVVSRHRRNGLIAFGYFFGPKRDSIPSDVGSLELDRNKAVLWARFGDQGLQDGSWPIIGVVPKWSPSAWPMPMFLSEQIGEPNVGLATLDESTFECVKVISKPRSQVERSHFAEDALYGYICLEEVLSDLLD